MLIALYLIFALALLAVLSLTILKIGRGLAACPLHGPRARPAALSIATGYAAIGGGVVFAVAGVLASVGGGLPQGLGALGFALITLGLGFGHALTTLRDVMRAPEAGAQKLAA